MAPALQRPFVLFAAAFLVMIGLYLALVRGAWLDGGGNVLVGVGLLIVDRAAKGSTRYRTGAALMLGGVALVLVSIAADATG
jgi:hypothetical protein